VHETKQLRSKPILHGEDDATKTNKDDEAAKTMAVDAARSMKPAWSMSQRDVVDASLVASSYRPRPATDPRHQGPVDADPVNKSTSLQSTYGNMRAHPLSSDSNHVHGQLSRYPSTRHAILLWDHRIDLLSSFTQSQPELADDPRRTDVHEAQVRKDSTDGP
jgi:hypothetical protein